MSTKKKRQISPKPRARGRPRKKVPRQRWKEATWFSAGFDVSMTSIAGAAIAHDRTLDRLIGPAFVQVRWTKDDHYFSRLETAVRSPELVQELQSMLRVMVAVDDCYIAQEEPFPAHTGFLKRAHGQSIKQQAEISGAFLGGLIRYGFNNVFQIGNDRWRKLVADHITEATGEDVTTHYSKWRSERLAVLHHCNLNDSGKFRSKQWALDVMAPWVGQMLDVEIPDWPDIVKTSKGNVPRPETSKARALQPDDRYDAFAIEEWMRREIERGATN